MWLVFSKTWEVSLLHGVLSWLRAIVMTTRHFLHYLRKKSISFALWYVESRRILNVLNKPRILKDILEENYMIRNKMVRSWKSAEAYCCADVKIALLLKPSSVTYKSASVPLHHTFRYHEVISISKVSHSCFSITLLFLSQWNNGAWSIAFKVRSNKRSWALENTLMKVLVAHHSSWSNG